MKSTGRVLTDLPNFMILKMINGILPIITRTSLSFGVRVIKNKGDEKRYKIEENLGYHFVVLRSANNREIARSCPKTLGGAEALIALLIAPPIPLAGATPVPEVDPERGSSNWWIWALAILALIVLFFLWRSCNDALTI